MTPIAILDAYSQTRQNQEPASGYNGTATGMM